MLLMKFLLNFYSFWRFLWIKSYRIISCFILRDHWEKLYIPRAFSSFLWRVVMPDISWFINEIKHKASEKGWLNCSHVQRSLWVRVEKQRMANESVPSVFTCFLLLGTSKSLRLFFPIHKKLYNPLKHVVLFV